VLGKWAFVEHTCFCTFAIKTLDVLFYATLKNGVCLNSLAFTYSSAKNLLIFMNQPSSANIQDETLFLSFLPPIYHNLLGFFYCEMAKNNCRDHP